MCKNICIAVRTTRTASLLEMEGKITKWIWITRSLVSSYCRANFRAVWEGDEPSVELCQCQEVKVTQSVWNVHFGCWRCDPCNSGSKLGKERVLISLKRKKLLWRMQKRWSWWIFSKRPATSSAALAARHIHLNQQIEPKTLRQGIKRNNWYCCWRNMSEENTMSVDHQTAGHRRPLSVAWRTSWSTPKP